MLNYLLSLSKIKNIKIVSDRSRLRPLDADLQVPNITKFSNATGWKPKINLNTGLLKTYISFNKISRY